MWFFRSKKKLNQSEIDKIKAEKCDMESLFANINNRAKAEILYKELAKQLHPDRYVLDLDKQKIAADLFCELQAHRTDYEEMLDIKQKITSLLK